MNKLSDVKNALFAILCTMGLVGVAACNRSPDTEAKSMESARMEIDSSDTKFFTEAAQGGMLEIKVAGIASIQASDPQVKEFAEMMLNDHQANNKMLLALATQKNVSLPPALDDKAQGIIDELKGKSGEDFDKAYSKDMVDAHKDMVDLLAKAAKESEDSDIRNFAKQTLPTVQHHLDMAQRLVKSE